MKSPSKIKPTPVSREKIRRHFKCSVCGSRIVKIEDGIRHFVYPKQMLCKQHTLLVRSIMDSFDWWRGWNPDNQFWDHDRFISKSWSVDDGWNEFILNNQWILDFHPVTHPNSFVDKLVNLFSKKL